jgi:hypothetical protein
MKFWVVSTSNQREEPPKIAFWELFIYLLIETASQHVGIGAIFYASGFKASTLNAIWGASTSKNEIWGGFPHRNKGRNHPKLNFDSVLCIFRSKKVPNMWIHVGSCGVWYDFLCI